MTQEGPPPSPAELRAWLGDIDIYVFDQLLKGRLAPPMRVLDAGCGAGRNVEYLLRAGFDVHAADSSADAVRAVRALASRLAPALPADHFRAEPVEALSFDGDWFDAVICSAVLHFARDHAHFEAMLRAMWRVLRPGGMLFVRTASRKGVEHLVVDVGGGRCRMPSGNVLYLVDEAALRAWTDRLGAEPLEPVKSTVVEGLRCMATWVVRKPG